MSIAKTYAEERPEPFATILELAADYGMEEVLRSLSDLALFDSEDTDACRARKANRITRAQRGSGFRLGPRCVVFPTLPRVTIYTGVI